MSRIAKKQCFNCKQTKAFSEFIGHGANFITCTTCRTESRSERKKEYEKLMAAARSRGVG
jgi:hypothetical protein